MKISRVALFLRGTFNKKSRETGSSKSLVWGKKTCSRFIGNTPSVTSRANLLNGKLKGFLSFKTAKIFYFSFSFFFFLASKISVKFVKRVEFILSSPFGLKSLPFIYIYIFGSLRHATGKISSSRKRYFLVGKLINKA